jgi:hypothetical protein
MKLRSHVLLVLCVAAAACGALWGAFEAGRMFAGYSHMLGGKSSAETLAETAALTARLHDAQARLAAAEAARRVDQTTYAEVERSVADLQSQLEEQRQELNFYRGIVRPGSGTFGIRIQRLRVLPSVAPHRFRVRVVLSQASRDNKPATASADLLITGQRGGHTVTLPLAQVATSPRPLNFSFRYFQELETEIELPVDFVAQRVQVEVRGAPGTPPLRQSFPWRIDTA